MEIIENREQWLQKYHDEFIADYLSTGIMDWNLYPSVRNKTSPFGKAVNLSTSRLMFITSSGLYHTNNQQPFDGANPFGDYNIRCLPSNIPFEEMSFAHDHFDQTAVNKDPQVLIPLIHLKNFVTEGIVGELSPSILSFMGYQPDATRVADETAVKILKIVLEEQVDAVLLVPT